jgi:quercetin dioxygenase-like cupin family protein
MTAVKSFAVFDEPVEILLASDATCGRSATMTQSSPPGGGPPPHSHQNEDETFFVIEGEYQISVNGVVYKLLPGEATQAMRGSIHTFRNVGATTGKMLIHIVPGGLENYLEEISHLQRRRVCRRCSKSPSGTASQSYVESYRSSIGPL